MKKGEWQALRLELGPGLVLGDGFLAICKQLERHPYYLDVFYPITQLELKKNKFNQLDLEANGRLVSMNETFLGDKTRTKAHMDETRFKEACRSTIQYQVDQFRNTTPCTCGSIEKLEVDHIIHFETLIAGHFLERPAPNAYAKDGVKNIFVGEVAETWRNYHQANATLRMLCKTCNCKRKKAPKVK
jgi:hypothetical protein